MKDIFLGTATHVEQIFKLPMTQTANLFMCPHCVMVEAMICQLARVQNFQSWLKICPDGDTQLVTMPAGLLPSWTLVDPIHWPKERGNPKNPDPDPSQMTHLPISWVSESVVSKTNPHTPVLHPDMTCLTDAAHSNKL